MRFRGLNRRLAEEREHHRRTPSATDAELRYRFAERARSAMTFYMTTCSVSLEWPTAKRVVCNQGSALDGHTDTLIRPSNSLQPVVEIPFAPSAFGRDVGALCVSGRLPVCLLLGVGLW